MLHVTRLCMAAPTRFLVPRSFILKMSGNMQWLAENFHAGRLHTPALWLAAELLRGYPTPLLNSCPGLAQSLSWWNDAASSARLIPHHFVSAIDIPSLVLSFGPSAFSSTAVPAVPIPVPRPGSRPVVALLTDAAGTTAVGGCWRSPGDTATQAFHALLTPEQLAWPAISPKELLGLVTFVESFGHEHEGAVLLAGNDNAGNVFVVNRLRINATDTVMTALMSRLLAACDLHRIDIIAWWCPRALNGISDDLSKSPSLLAARRVASRLGLVLRT